MLLSFLFLTMLSFAAISDDSAGDKKDAPAVSEPAKEEASPASDSEEPVKTRQLLPKDAPYTDPATGVVFPAEISSYTKHQVTRNLNPVYGTAIRYFNEIGSCADIYIYSLDTSAAPVNQEQFAEHYKETKEVIMKLPAGAGPVNSVACVEEFKFNGRPDILGCAFLIGVEDDDEIYSELIMFLFKGNIVKMRITYETNNPSEKESAYQFSREIIRLFEKIPAN